MRARPALRPAGVFVSLVLLVLGFLGVLLALVLIAGGLAMIFWSRRRW
ncbi:MAG: hypothetical protein OK442_02040 [Thaumarchaeota archaeon]|nr:hypothetical protein [Nitrososphaerota archaeon]